MKPLLGRLSWRVGLALLVFSLAVLAFESGVSVSDRQGIESAGFMTKVYYSLGLFALGGMDLGVPKSGPWWGRVMLWMSYFGCPAVATAAIGEGFLFVLRSANNGVRRLSDHYVLVGQGEVAEAYADIIREMERDPATSLVVSPGPEGAEREADTARGVNMVSGGVKEPRFADETYLSEARSIALLSDDDIYNLESYIYLTKELGVEPSRLVVHLSDISLMRDVQKSGVVDTNAELFNSHQIAAECLVEEKIASFFRETDYTDEVVLAGFGRFGQSMLETLDRKVAEQFDRVFLLDHEAAQNYRIFREQVELDGSYDLHTIDGDMHDPDSWSAVTEMLADTTREPVVVLGADDDAVNLRVALWLHAEYPDCRIFVRTIGNKHLAGELAEKHHFELEDVHRRMKMRIRTEDAFRIG